MPSTSDLSDELSSQEFHDIHEAWPEHLVLAFHDQRPTEVQQIAFGRRVGELDRRDATPLYRLADNPEIFQITHKNVSQVASAIAQARGLSA